MARCKRSSLFCRIVSDEGKKTVYNIDTSWLFSPPDVDDDDEAADESDADERDADDSDDDAELQ